VGTRPAVTYVIVAVVLVLVIASFVTFMVLNTTNRRGAAAREPAPPGIGADEETPLGDTPEHTDERTGSARIVGRHETDDPDDAAHRARPGEAEGEERIRFEPERPASGRLGDRDR
jgi:hypothetical protein